MKRVMCVYLPQWPLQRLWRRRPELRDRAVVIVASNARGARVVRACPRASTAGIRAGMSLAEARAVERWLHVEEDDLETDRRSLEKLAHWAERYSPLVSLEEGPTPQSLILDITGCAAAFHGEDRLARLAYQELHQHGLSVRIALADTLGAAWAMAHYAPPLAPRFAGRGETVWIIPPGEVESAVRPLPVAALRLPADVLPSLASLGIDRIGQLLDWPRSTLPGRFGPELLRRLDQMLGRVPELIRPCRFAPEIEARYTFEQPTTERAFLDHALDELLERIVETLTQDQRGAKHLECWFHHETVPPVRVDLRLFQPTLNVSHLRKLLQTRLEQVRLEAPVAALSLRVPVVEATPERQSDFFEEEQANPDELAALIDRLVSRLGRNAVTFATLVADPQPEYACRFEPAVAAEGRSKRKPVGNTIAATPPLDLHVFDRRPMLVWPEPEAIEVLALAPEGSPARFCRGETEHTIVRSWGPERIETGWWRGNDVERDYYIVETQTGTRWWLFRRRHDRRWFLHGCFE